MAGNLIHFGIRTKEDIKSYKKAGNKIVLARIGRILEELEIHPETGIGRPEKKKHNLSGLWSREIDKKNRMLYQIKENIITVTVISAIGHYDDK